MFLLIKGTAPVWSDGKEMEPSEGESRYPPQNILLAINQVASHFVTAEMNVRTLSAFRQIPFISVNLQVCIFTAIL